MINTIKILFFTLLLCGCGGVNINACNGENNCNGNSSNIGIEPSNMSEEFISPSDLDGDGIFDQLDLDIDGDGLIELRTAEEFDAIRDELTCVERSRFINGSGIYTYCQIEGNTLSGSYLGCDLDESGNSTCKGYEIINDLDFSNIEYKPIFHRFVGSIDGNGYSMINITIDRTKFKYDANYVGIFASLDAYYGSIYIRNLQITGLNILNEDSKFHELIANGLNYPVDRTTGYYYTAIGGLIGIVFRGSSAKYIVELSNITMEFGEIHGGHENYLHEGRFQSTGALVGGILTKTNMNITGIKITGNSLINGYDQYHGGIIGHFKNFYYPPYVDITNSTVNVDTLQYVNDNNQTVTEYNHIEEY